MVTAGDHVGGHVAPSEAVWEVPPVRQRRPVDAGFAACLAAARAGDGQAWSQLYHGIAPLLIGYLRAQRLPDPEDVAGEVLLEVVRDLHRFEGDERNFRSWVLAIAHHRLLDARRRAARRPLTLVANDELPPGSEHEDPATEPLTHLGFGELEPALATLTEDQRNVLLLRVVADLSVREVAEIVGKREGAVKQLQRRAADAMRRHLDADADPPPREGERPHHPGARAPRTMTAPRVIATLEGAHHDTWNAG